MRRCALGASLLLAGCGVLLHGARGPDVPTEAALQTRADRRLVVRSHQSERCLHGASGREGAFREPLPGPLTDQTLLPFVASLDPGVRRTAAAAGIEPLLARLLARRRDDGATPSPEQLSMRAELAERVATLEVQLNAMEFEVDCVRGLVFEVLAAYDEIETDRQLELTVWTLGVGAATGVAATLWDVANAHTTEPAWEDGPVAVSVAGAAATTALGAITLVREPRASLYLHEHNVLTPIVTGDDPDMIYPVFVFRLLTLPAVDAGPTPREALAALFDDLLHDGASEDELDVAREVLYGAGGIYDEDLLRAHQEHLRELGATLDSFAREIDTLTETLASTLEMDFADPPGMR